MFSARGGFQGDTVAGDTDPYWNNVEMLITARTGTLVDATGKASIILNYDSNGGTVYSTPVKYNPYSFGQNAGRWAITNRASRNASAVFTHELWFRSMTSSATSVYEVPWMIDPINASAGGIIGQIGTTNNNRWSINSIGGSNYNFTTSNVYDQQWHHVCFTRNSSNLITFYYDGVAAATTVTSTTTFTFGNQMLFGGAAPPPQDNSSNCYFDDIRLTIGVCRYTGNFTPPVGPLPIG